MMTNDDYTLIKALVNEAVQSQVKEMKEELFEMKVHLKEIKELLYNKSLVKETNPYIPPYTVTYVADSYGKRVLNG